MTQKLIGMPGAMSRAGSAEYYRLINEGVRGRLGGLHAAAAVDLALG
jgi:aspartate racemase